VTMYDPDAPSGSGFWHWAVADIPARVTGLPTGAGDGTGEHVPAGAFHLPNDVRLGRFIGAGPRPGDGRHRYVIVVQALGIEKVRQLQLQVQADSTPAWLGFSINISGHLLGRAVITPWAEIPAA
jgi:Raf kinase inhibitor-like YbhB/YbcL family protein